MLSTHVETGMDVSLARSGCRFCDVASREKVVAQSASATAFPSLGSLVDGWMLIAPRRHVVATAELSDDEWAGIASLAEEVACAVNATYGPTVMFEHGSAGINRTAGCGVDHAHLHVVPWTGNLRDQIAAVPSLPRFVWESSTRRPELDSGRDYIWLADDTGEWITHADELPSQVVRQAISARLGLDWWDWKSNLRFAAADATRHELSFLA